MQKINYNQAVLQEKTNSRILFINFLSSKNFTDDSEENDISNMYFDCQFDDELLQLLIKTYNENKESINNFIQNNDITFVLEKCIVAAGCTELIINHPVGLVIFEYLKISDNLGGMSSMIHKTIDKFYAHIHSIK